MATCLQAILMMRITCVEPAAVDCMKRLLKEQGVRDS